MTAWVAALAVVSGSTGCDGRDHWLPRRQRKPRQDTGVVISVFGSRGEMRIESLKIVEDQIDTEENQDQDRQEEEDLVHLAHVQEQERV